MLRREASAHATRRQAPTHTQRQRERGGRDGEGEGRGGGKNKRGGEKEPSCRLRASRQWRGTDP